MTDNNSNYLKYLKDHIVRKMDKNEWQLVKDPHCWREGDIVMKFSVDTLMKFRK